jgi:hypothetical protein
VDIVVYSLILPSSVFGVVHEESLAGFGLAWKSLVLPLKPPQVQRFRDVSVANFEQNPRSNAENGSPEKS